MAKSEHYIDFEGYYYIDEENIPDYSGVYCIYTGTVNTKLKEVSQLKLIYIGQTEDINCRIKNHERMQDWKDCLESGEEICFSFGRVKTQDLDRYEAALIFEHKPRLNKQCTNSFSFDEITINLSGAIANLRSNFKVG